MYFCSTILSIIGSILTLFAFLLELFVLIGQLSNKPFLRDLYYGQASNPSKNTAYNFNLWNYCTADLSGNVQSCSQPKPAYNWAQTPGISNVVQAQSQSSLVSGLFLGLFILMFIGTGLSLIFWLMSLPMCCLWRKRRGAGMSMSTLLFINFFVTLIALILALVLCLRGIRILHSGDPNWNGRAGNSMWCTIGAVVSLFLAFLCYSVGSCCCARRRDTVDPVGKGQYGSPIGAQNGVQDGVQSGSQYNGPSDGQYNQYGSNKTGVQSGSQYDSPNGGQYNQYGSNKTGVQSDPQYDGQNGAQYNQYGGNTAIDGGTSNSPYQGAAQMQQQPYSNQYAPQADTTQQAYAMPQTTQTVGDGAGAGAGAGYQTPTLTNTTPQVYN